MFLLAPYTESFKMSNAFQSFVGVDLHKCSVTLTAVDAAGETKRLKISTKSTGKIDAWLRALPGPVWMAVEACPFVEWFIDRYRDCVARIDIADATELASRRGKRRKNEKHHRERYRDIQHALQNPVERIVERFGRGSSEGVVFVVFDGSGLRTENRIHIHEKPDPATRLVHGPDYFLPRFTLKIRLGKYDLIDAMLDQDVA